MVDLRPGRVEVLWRSCRPLQHAPAETDHPTAQVVDREHDAPAEAVEQLCRGPCGMHSPVFSRYSSCTLPSPRASANALQSERPAELKGLDRFFGESALTEVGHADGTAFLVPRTTVRKDARVAVEDVDFRVRRAVGFLAGRARSLDLDVVALGQVPQGFGSCSARAPSRSSPRRRSCRSRKHLQMLRTGLTLNEGVFRCGTGKGRAGSCHAFCWTKSPTTSSMRTASRIRSMVCARS